MLIKFFKAILVIVLVVIASFWLFQHFSQPAEADTDDNVSGWAWSETVGWISFNCTDRGVCGSSDYGVNIDGSGNFSGYAWSENIGWINFAPAGPYPAAPNYSAKYNSGTGKVTGWARAHRCITNPADCNGWDGWILLGKETGGWANQVTIDSGTKDFHGWAWGSDVVGWISFNCADRPGVVCNQSPYKVTAAGINLPPTATNLNKTDPNWCGSPPNYSFSWTFSDPDGDTESRFDFQIDDDSGFNVPVVVSRSYGGLSNPSPSQNTQTAIVAVSPPNPDIYYGKTYYWRVRVWDSQDANSGWVNGSPFNTEPRHRPDPDFTWLPQNPSALEPVQFTDDSTCYDDVITGSACSDPNDSFNWAFPNANPLTSTLENPVATPSVSGDWDVKLKVTDSYMNWCEDTKTIPVDLPLPEWKEVIPK